MTRKKDRKGTIRRLLKYLYDCRFRLFLALLCTAAGNYFSLLIPKYSGKAIDAIGTDGTVDFSVITENCKWMLVFVLGGMIFTYITQMSLVRVSASITARMRKEVYDHLQSLPVAFFDRHPVGDIISRISYDIDTINTSLSADIVTIFTTLFTVIGSLIMMIRIAPVLCLVFAVTLPIILFITRYRARKVRPLFSKRSRLLGELNGFSEEMLSGHKTIKAYGQEENTIKKFSKRNIEAVDAYYEAEYQGSFVGPTVNWINNLSLALVSGFGAVLYLYNRITLGNISTFILYSRKFSRPISELANIFAELQSALSAAERVFALIDEETEVSDVRNPIILEDVEGRVKFEDVSFSYLPGKEVLHHISLEAYPGHMIAIVGPTGAGKTTIINLLMRFYDPDSGVISVDGHPLTDISRESLRRQFTMVLQETWLFEGSVYDNVAYGSENATREDVIRVCKEAHIHNFIMSLKDGYDTILTDDGVSISKGQKQLLTIARAMLSDARILILDEATSNVDSHTEKQIQKAIRKLCQDRTTFIIAHRLSTIQEADHILVLQKGKIIEEGNHEQLLERKGFYASLFNAQWENGTV